MLTSTLLSLGSLVLGVFAWITPFIAIRYLKKNQVKKSFHLIIASFSACIASLCLVLFEINFRVQIRDWSALMDTMDTLVWIAVILSIITFILNIFCIGKIMLIKSY